MKIYISSTLNDLRPERQAIKDVLVTMGCSIKESYQASESDLVTSIMEDIAECHVYILILGRRYGFVPPEKQKSITVLEYEQAVERGVPRFVFVKNGATFEQSDAGTGEHDPKLIDAFRKRVTSGERGETRAAEFSTPDDLKVKVQQVVYDYQLRRKKTTPGVAGLLGSAAARESHPWEIRHELSVACVPGSDDSWQRSFAAAAAAADQRVTTFPLAPAKARDYLAALDPQLRRSRCGAIAITATSLSRFAPVADEIATAIRVVRARTAAIVGLLVDVEAADLPAPLRDAFTDCFKTTSADWVEATRAATFETFAQWRRARAPETTDGIRIGIPFMVVALNADEALAMDTKSDELFAEFEDDAQKRKKQFFALQQRLHQSTLDAQGKPLPHAPQWPNDFYGPTRNEWRPFGASAPTMIEFVEKAAEKIARAAVGSRERRLVGDTRLVPLSYSFDEYLDLKLGGRDNVERVCEQGCLLLLDEFALLHPRLRGAVDALLASNNVAVVSLCACDPSLSPLSTLLSEPSYLRIGNLHARFSQIEDPRCELALNSIHRLQRWLRLVLPELKATLGSQHGDQDLLERSEELFASRR